MPVEWALHIVITIFKVIHGDIRNCSCYRAVKLLEHGMNGGQGVIKRLCRIVTVDELQIGFMLMRGTIDTAYLEKASRRVSC